MDLEDPAGGRSAVIAALETAGALTIAVAMYNLETAAAVDFLASAPRP